MELDEELCLCFHVTRRKVENFLRIESPRSVGQLAECYGAGSGCGWCRPYLRRLFEASRAGMISAETLPSSAEYARGRGDYMRQGGGRPPDGATPVPSAGGPDSA